MIVFQVDDVDGTRVYAVIPQQIDNGILKAVWKNQTLRIPLPMIFDMVCNNPSAGECASLVIRGKSISCPVGCSRKCEWLKDVSKFPDIKRNIWLN